MTEKKNLNLGGGGNWKEEGWQSVDIALGHDLSEKFLFQYETSSADLIYFSHTLEHLSWDIIPKMLGECYRVLALSGTIRIVVPDVDYLWHIIKLDYKYDLVHENHHYYNPETQQDRITRPPVEDVKELIGYISDDDFLKNGFHFSFFSESSLSIFLKIAGFKNIQRSSYNESPVPELRKSSTLDGGGIASSGFDNTILRSMSLYMEASK